MSLEIVNRICPNCKNPNYMVLLGDFSKAYKYKCMNCNGYFNDIDFGEPIQPVWLKEQEKKEIKLHKKHVITWKRDDVFNMRNLYEAVCETLLDEGELIIARTDDHEKVEFVFYVTESGEAHGYPERNVPDREAGNGIPGGDDPLLDRSAMD